MEGRQVQVPRSPARGWFDRFAEASASFVSRAAFFAIAVLLTAIWLPTIFLFNSIDTWQLVINTVDSIGAFLLIALLQNSERRYDEALHKKVDALAAALADLMDHEAGLDGDRLPRHIQELRAAVGLERKV